MQPGSENDNVIGTEEDGRRAFLKKCGTYAAITPPAVTFLLSTTLSSKAIAASSGHPAHGGKGGKGWGMGGSKGRGHGPTGSSAHGPGGSKGHSNGKGNAFGHSKGGGKGH